MPVRRRSVIGDRRRGAYAGLLLRVLGKRARKRQRQRFEAWSWSSLVPADCCGKVLQDADRGIAQAREIRDHSSDGGASIRGVDAFVVVVR